VSGEMSSESGWAGCRLESETLRTSAPNLLGNVSTPERGVCDSMVWGNGECENGCQTAKRYIVEPHVKHIAVVDRGVERETGAGVLV